MCEALSYGTADFLYAWLHRWSSCLSLSFFVFFPKNDWEFPALVRREWILYRNLNKNKSRWKSIDTCRHTSSHLHSIHDCIICWRKILLSILFTKEHHFLIMSPVAYFYQSDSREKKVTQSRSLVHLFQIDDAFGIRASDPQGSFWYFGSNAPFFRTIKSVDVHEKVTFFPYVYPTYKRKDHSMIDITWFGQDIADSYRSFSLFFSYSRIRPMFVVLFVYITMEIYSMIYFIW